jgi:hypothetical protein
MEPFLRMRTVAQMRLVRKAPQRMRRRVGRFCQRVAWWWDRSVVWAMARMGAAALRARGKKEIVMPVMMAAVRPLGKD